MQYSFKFNLRREIFWPWSKLWPRQIIRPIGHASSAWSNLPDKTSHTLFFTIMNTKKMGTFQFCFPGLLGIHTIPNWKEVLKSCEPFWRKSQFSTLTYLNLGFGGPWHLFAIFFVNVNFIMFQKKSFCQKNVWISCMGSKVPFWQFFNSDKMALLNPCMKFKYS